MSDSPASLLDCELQELLDEVAAAWEIDRDYRVAVHLAAEFPDAADEIYALLDSLVHTAIAPTPPAEEREATARALRAMIENGPESTEDPISPAAQPLPTSDEPLIDYAVEVTGLRPSQVADSLGVTASFLDDVNTHPESVPPFILDKIIDLAEARLSLDRDHVEQALSVNPRRRMAACRFEPYTPADVTYEQILARSGMSQKQRQEWDLPPLPSASPPPR